MKSMRYAVIVSFLLCSVPLFGVGLDRIVVDPALPREGEPFEILLSGIWPSGPKPMDPHVTLQQGRIEISLAASYDGFAVVSPWGERLHVGPLAAGSYEIIVRGAGEELGRQTVVVEARPFRVAPAAGLAGTEMLLQDVHMLRDCSLDECLEVRFGGVPVEFPRESGPGEILVSAPNHDPGLVDVTVRNKITGAVATATNAFRYGGPISGADFDRVLFPMTFRGAGAHGSDWTTRIFVRNDSPLLVDTEPQIWVDLHAPSPQPPIRQPFPPGGRAQFHELTSETGRFFYVPRGLESFFSYSSHVLDLSRASTNLGSEIPVVRAGDTAQQIRLVDVPLDPRFRGKLRIYDWDTNPREVAVTVIRAADDERFSFGMRLSAVVVSCPRAPCLQPWPAFASIDLSSIPEIAGDGRADVIITANTNDARLWAFVSVTNNETQQVTLYTPQQARAR